MIFLFTTITSEFWIKFVLNITHATLFSFTQYFSLKVLFSFYTKSWKKNYQLCHKKRQRKQLRKEVQEFDLLESGLNFNLCCCYGQVAENNGVRIPTLYWTLCTQQKLWSSFSRIEQERSLGLHGPNHDEAEADCILTHLGQLDQVIPVLKSTCTCLCTIALIKNVTNYMRRLLIGLALCLWVKVREKSSYGQGTLSKK